MIYSGRYGSQAYGGISARKSVVSKIVRKGITVLSHLYDKTKNILGMHREKSVLHFISPTTVAISQSKTTIMHHKEIRTPTGKISATTVGNGSHSNKDTMLKKRESSPLNNVTENKTMLEFKQNPTYTLKNKSNKTIT